jgi:hypothetical protein
MIDIGIFEGEDGPSKSTTMKVYSRVALHDDEGTMNDDWVNDSFLEGIGERSGTWTYMMSQQSLILWGRALEFQARLRGVTSWPLKNEQRGSIELRKPIYGSRVLSYSVWIPSL